MREMRESAAIERRLNSLRALSVFACVGVRQCFWWVESRKEVIRVIELYGGICWRSARRRE